MPKAAPAGLVAGGDAVRRISVPIAQRAAAAGTYDAEAHTVDLIVATEGLVRMPGYQLGLLDDYYYEILDCSPTAVDFSQVAADNCPVLDAHDRYEVESQLGKLRDASCENSQVIGRCYFGQSECAQSVEADVAAGTAPKVSAGYRREQAIFERFEGEVPVYRITKWTLQEASFVPIAADPTAGVRAEEQVIFPCIINEGTRTMTDQTNTAAGAAVQPEDGQPTGAAPAAPAPAATPDATRAAPAGQEPKVSQFSGAAALAFVANARAFDDTLAQRAQELVEKNSKGEVSVEAATDQLLKATADAQRAATSGISTGGTRVEVGTDERDKFILGASNSIIQRAGLTNLFIQAAKAKGEDVAVAQRALDPGEFRGVMNAELARIALERAGVRISTYDRAEIVGLAMTTQRAAGLNTTSDFAVLLENVMHKTLQAAYNVAPDTWQRFCGIGSVVDFRAHPRYLRGTFGVLDSRTEAGEFKNKSIPDGAKESITAVPKGNIVGLTRDAIVNDDLGAFNFITVEMGRMAKLSIEADVYALLAQNGGLGPSMNDGLPLFDAAHSNIAATPAAPSVNAFDLIAVQMASQKDLSGNEYLDVRPSILLVPIALRGDSIVINAAQYDPDTASKLQKPNKVRGLFDDVVGTPRLAGTRYYAFADKDMHPAIEVAFLNGVQEPYLEQQLGWRFDGTEFKVRHDYGVGGINFRSAVTNAGA